MLFVASAWSQGEAQPVQSGPPIPEVRNEPPAPEVPDISRGSPAPLVGPPSPGLELSIAPDKPVVDTTSEALSRPPLPAFKPTYRNFADAALWLGALANAVPDIASTLEVGSTTDGRPVPALELAARGDVPKAERPTVFLLGALDGRSGAGAEAVLAIVHQLLEVPERLPAGVTIVAIPWASPEGLDVLAAGGVSDGANARPVDDDRDGALDEDPPDDLNDDGVIQQLLIEDSAGEWVRCSDGRFLAQAGPLDQPRYRLALEGRDDDADGQFNEDGPGGVVLERNFPLGRGGPWLDPRAGTLPMSEPLTRALAELVLSRKCAAVLVFQGNHGGVAMPGGVATLDALFAGDRLVYERLARQYAAASGRVLEGVWTAREASGADRPGCSLDWFAGVVGALSLEIAVWGPRVDLGSEVAVRDARFNGAAHPPTKPIDTRPAPADELRAWAYWLDNPNAGIGFDDWSRTDAGTGIVALLGGWRPRTLFDPPEAKLPRALQGSPEFVVELLASLPRLEPRVLEATRDGDVCRLRVRVENPGRLPSGPTLARLPRGSSALTVELGMPAGARLLAGEPRTELGRLVGGESSGEVGWVVLAAPGSTFEVAVDAPWCTRVVREVKP